MIEELTEIERRARVDKLEHKIRRLKVQLTAAKHHLEVLKPVKKKTDAKLKPVRKKTD